MSTKYSKTVPVIIVSFNIFVQGKLMSGKMSDFRQNSKERKSSELWVGVGLSDVRLIQMFESDVQCSILFYETGVPH